MFDAATGSLLLSLPVTGDVRCLSFCPDGRVLAGVTDRAVLHLWDSGAGAGE